MGPFELLQRIVEILERLQIPYLVTGSVAAMAYGEARLTNDIDIIADVKEEHIPCLLNAFPIQEFYISGEMIKNAIRYKGQFNIIHPASGFKIDVIIKKNTPFDECRFKRVHRIYPAETYQANFSSPEDVIIKKIDFYRQGGSEKHLRDITGILKISGGIIDMDYITQWADRLGLRDIWDAVVKRVKE